MPDRAPRSVVAEEKQSSLHRQPHSTAYEWHCSTRKRQLSAPSRRRRQANGSQHPQANDYRPLFMEHYITAAIDCPICFAQPGIERQDSVYNGLQAISSSAKLVAVHDSARPLIMEDDARRCMHDALRVGAAVLGVAVKPTIKQVDALGNVVQTLERAGLWEVQTPQVIRPALLREGFQMVRSNHLAVTDDVSIIEAMGLPVHVTKGSYSNIKVTTPDDMMVAENLLSQQRAAAIQGPHLAASAAERSPVGLSAKL
ncbi:hypothetical protein WJX73_005122 [Symbiochloris irregularis]|uniref:2-C-methyl-D-erythritol 4-phosphate cytidylyltransferase n=1 Tax=Symbiochloris irregularis TaxID=706552 RepID=A0AAW1NWW2_9CHLO